MNSKCKGCDAEILWVKTEHGRNQPLDIKPEKRIILINENIFVNGAPATTRVAKVVDTYMSHHATCPDVEKFRKSK